MSPEHKRIVEMGAGWEDSGAEITLGPADAAVLKALGAPLKEGKRETDPCRITGRDLFRAGELLKKRDATDAAGEEPAPKPESAPKPPAAPPAVAPVVPAPAPTVPPAAPSPPTVPPTAPADGLEEHTVAELREIATAEGVTISSSAVKAQILDAIRKARAAK
ncbi:MAG TPA: hypothetical protein VGE74_30085 [Gemmata sp.]